MGYNYAPSRADKGTTNNFASVIRICLFKDVSMWSSGLTDFLCSDSRRAEGQLPLSIWVHALPWHLPQGIYAATQPFYAFSMPCGFALVRAVEKP